MELNGVTWRVVDSRGDAAGFRWGQIGDEFVAQWAGALTMRTNADGIVTAFEQDPAASPATIEKIRSGIARAFQRSLSGKRSLHASAVEQAGAALLFIGPSGAGKSTLAAHLCSSRAFRLLADDVTAIDREWGSLRVPPTEPHLWLIAEDTEHPTKISVAAQRAVSPALLRRIIALRFDDSVRAPVVQPLRGADAVGWLTRAAVRFDATAISMKDELEATSELLAKAAVLEFVRPRRIAVDVAAEALIGALGLHRSELYNDRPA